MGDDNISASCTRVGCYGTATSLACADMLSATSILGLGGWGVGDATIAGSFSVLSHRKQKCSGSQTLPLV